MEKISSSESPGLINILGYTEGAAFSLDFTKQNVGGSAEPIIPQLLKKKIKKRKRKNKETRTKPKKKKKPHFSYDYVIFTRIYTFRAARTFETMKCH